MSQKKRGPFGPVMEFAGKHSIKILITASVIVFLIGLALTLTPRYLVYADPLGKSDIIVLFVGSDQDSRHKEALQLLQEGHSKYLFIPALFSLYKAGPAKGSITGIRFTDIKPGIKLPGPCTDQEMTDVYFRKNRAANRFPRYYEATHVEMLLAKKAMDACGFRKAIFVSSPYHMRRIRMISRKVFGERELSISYVPTRYERVPDGLQSMGGADLAFITSEFIKICWFSMYSPFS